MAKKQVIRLTESDLHKIIKESVKNVLNEEHNNLKKQNINEYFMRYFRWNESKELFNTIYDAAQQIMQMAKEGYHKCDSNDKYKNGYREIYSWAFDVMNGARFYEKSSSPTPMENGYEDEEYVYNKRLPIDDKPIFRNR